MEYTRLRSSGLKISRIAMGTMSFGEGDSGREGWPIPVRGPGAVLPSSPRSRDHLLGHRQRLQRRHLGKAAILMLSGGSPRQGQHTPEQLQQALRTEFADVLCQVLLLARHHDVDLQAAVEEKWLRRNPDWMLRQTKEENR
jgi:hypothetical protein